MPRLLQRLACCPAHHRLTAYQPITTPQRALTIPQPTTTTPRPSPLLAHLVGPELDGIKGQVAQQEGAVAGKDAAPPLPRQDRAQRGEGVGELACGGGSQGGAGAGGKAAGGWGLWQAGLNTRRRRRRALGLGVRSGEPAQRCPAPAQRCAPAPAPSYRAAGACASTPPPAPVCIRVFTTSVGTRTREEARPAATPPASGPRYDCCSPTRLITACSQAAVGGRWAVASGKPSHASPQRHGGLRGWPGGCQGILTPCHLWPLPCTHTQSPHQRCPVAPCPPKSPPHTTPPAAARRAPPASPARTRP